MKVLIGIAALFVVIITTGCSSDSKNTTDNDSSSGGDNLPVTDAPLTDAPVSDEAFSAEAEAPLQADDTIPVTDADQLLELVAIPEGSFEMGDHSGYNDPKHPSDELPLHTVTLSAFSIAKTETTAAQYLVFLKAQLAAGKIEIKDNLVYGKEDGLLYCDTANSWAPNFITWDGKNFGVTAGYENHPMSGVRWEGAAAFTNWYSVLLGLEACYNLKEGTVDYTKTCIRLPTEAEWEYAGRGGQYDPYYSYPWGNGLKDGSGFDVPEANRLNRDKSADPWESGPQPALTPTCFYDGSLQKKSAYNWPSPVESYQTLDGRNAFGLCDMAGNVWEWVNDWYAKAYYAASPEQDPTGPTAGDPMPDGKPYHNLRGGSFFNSTLYPGDHERVSNRDPAYFRGKYLDKDDPNGPWFHIGFRVVLQKGSTNTGNSLTLTSTAFDDGGTLPADYTCDGAGNSPPLAWSGAPAQTAEFALMMTTLAKDGEKWNWILYHIPSSVAALEENSEGIGTAGSNSDGGALAYAPPCSTGPGAKQYTFTLYALSESPELNGPAAGINGDTLTKAISGITLAKSSITVSYTRQ